MQLGITGAELITSVAAGRENNFQAFCKGMGGDKPLQHFDTALYRFGRAYEIDDRAHNQPDTPGRATHWLRTCIAGAVAEAGLTAVTDARIAVLVGTGLRELRSLELWWANHLPFHVSDLHFGAAVRQEVDNPQATFTFSNACAAANFALGLGADLIQLGEIDAAIVAGCDSITESMFGTFDRITHQPPERVVPFDRRRKGVLMGEGATAVVLEPLAQAQARGKAPLALLRGVGINCDAHHETAPHLEGMREAMAEAHQRAGVTAADIDLLMIHGTGTELNDQVEALAIRELFGTAANRIPISGLKSMTGHTSGASGLIGVVVAIEALNQGCIPPTAGFSEPIPEAEGMHIVAGRAYEAQMRLAQVNAFGFGGLNAVVILEKAAH